MLHSPEKDTQRECYPLQADQAAREEWQRFPDWVEMSFQALALKVALSGRRGHPGKRAASHNPCP